MTTVYVYSAQDGSTIYVGVTGDQSLRMKDHRQRDWWPTVATARFEHFDTRAEAVARERELIRALAPLRNLTDTQRVSGADIRARRIRLAWSREKLAGLAGLSMATIERLEAGTAVPRRATLKVIEDALERGDEKAAA